MDFKENIRKEIRKQVCFIILEEDFEFVDNEGPQPGDAEYHYPKLEKMPMNSKFEDIDWKVLHEILINNTKAQAEHLNHVLMYTNTLTDVVDGYLTIQDFSMLEDADLVYDSDGVPIIENSKYQDFNEFFNKAKEIWNK